MKKNLNISLIQSDISWKDINKNLSHFSALISRIEKTDVILLPEMFNTAFCPASNHLAETMNGRTLNWMKEVAQKRACAICGSLMIQENGKVYNRLIWISRDGDISIYNKRHLFSLAKEHKNITKGEERLIIEIDGWRILPLICYDLRFPVFSRNDVDYDILIYLANWPTKRVDAWDTLLKARAIENQCYTIGLNRIGKDGDGIPFNGHSKIFGAFGKELLCAPKNEEKVLQIELSWDNLILKRRQMNFLQDRDDFILQ
ncbi:MAG: amidohydrolase [Flavobacteriales bacterium]|nr:amidohydrolase [Flavobacteriales bacterium]|tara:strand:+ start:6023 stop:6799 length:777 start_codon:yes stop_codon:yes gene_type:complete